MSHNFYNLPTYPTAELQCARSDFIARWNSALQRDPLVRCISEWHRTFPPNIRLKNCAEYPFDTNDLMYRVPHQVDLPESEKPVKRRKLNDSISQHCSRLTEAVLFGDNTKQTSQNHQGQSTVFICDCCQFTTKVRSSAWQHLETEKHSSCSRYICQDTPSELGDSLRMPLLRDPRILYNRSIPNFAWLSEKTVIACPSCFLVFPDKLMCAYHHQTHHHKFSPSYVFGNVVAVRQLSISSTLTCHQCRRSFSSQAEFAQHWDLFGCPSPFLPIPAQPGHQAATMIIQAYCHVCQSWFQHSGIQPNASSSSSSTTPVPVRKGRKRRKSTDDDSMCYWASGQGRFCLNHLYLHVKKALNPQHSMCHMHVRVIKVFRAHALTQPAYQLRSDEDLLLFCINECRRYLAYLKTLKGFIRGFYKETLKTLTGLEQQAKQLIG